MGVELHKEAEDLLLKVRDHLSRSTEPEDIKMTVVCGPHMIMSTEGICKEAQKIHDSPNLTDIERDILRFIINLAARLTEISNNEP